MVHLTMTLIISRVMNNYIPFFLHRSKRTVTNEKCSNFRLYLFQIQYDTVLLVHLFNYCVSYNAIIRTYVSMNYIS